MTSLKLHNECEKTIRPPIKNCQSTKSRKCLCSIFLGNLTTMYKCRSLSEEYAVVGENVIVNKPESSMHNKLGEIWKVRTNGNRIKVSVSFDGEIYNFYSEELILA